MPIEPGFWRVGDEYDIMHRCLEGHCIGNLNTSFVVDEASRLSFANPDSLCATGHRGPYCKVCRSGYYMELGYCMLCQNDERDMYPIYIGGGACMVVFLVGVVLALRGGKKNARRLISANSDVLHCYA